MGFIDRTRLHTLGAGLEEASVSARHLPRGAAEAVLTPLAPG